MLTPDSLREKEAVKSLVAELVASCLWHPEITESHGETDEHDIVVRRVGNGVEAKIRRK
uniref:Uncharacterized protein n=1 Tax=viral metagenome TaxID=1070528 RepID=A0A6M3JH94_9ZZZZ